MKRRYAKRNQWFDEVTRSLSTTEYRVVGGSQSVVLRYNSRKELEVGLDLCARPQSRDVSPDEFLFSMLNVAASHYVFDTYSHSACNWTSPSPNNAHTIVLYSPFANREFKQSWESWFNAGRDNHVIWLASPFCGRNQFFFVDLHWTSVFFYQDVDGPWRPYDMLLVNVDKCTEVRYNNSSLLDDMVSIA